MGAVRMSVQTDEFFFGGGGGGDFDVISLEELLLWIMDLYFGQKQWSEVKTLLWICNYKQTAFHFTRR